MFNVDILSAVDGPGSHCTKSEWYDALDPEELVNTVKDKSVHTQRRRMWDNAFSPKGLPIKTPNDVLPLTEAALADYTRKIIAYASHLERQIAATAGRPTDASFLLYEFSFDLMGDFAFARNALTNASKDPEWYDAISALQKGMSLLGPLSPVPWLLHIGLTWRWIPIVKNWFRMVAFCKKCMAERLTVIMTFFMDQLPK